LHFDTSHMVIDEIAVASGCGIFETFADRIDNQSFDLRCRDSTNKSGKFGLSLDQR
jgi:hypothetical protein